MKATEHSARSASAITRSVAILMGMVLFAGVLTVVPAALGAPPVTFAGPGTGAGQVEHPAGVAVDQSNGTVYVADLNNSRVDEFDSAGHFLRAFGWGVLNGAAELQVCSTTCEVGLQGSGRGQINKPIAVAVDQSSHDVYVSDLGNERVEEFSPAGEFILMFGKGVDKTTGGDICTAVLGDTCGAGSRGETVPGAVNGPAAMAFDASGSLWVGETNRLERFSPEGAFLSEVLLPGAGNVHSLAIDTDPSSPSFGDFYTLKGYVGGVEERQEFTPPSSGEYTLCFEGQCTQSIRHDANEEEVQSALEALSTIGPGNIGVQVRDLKFQGSLAGTDVPQITASAGTTVKTNVQGEPGVPGVISKRKPNGEVVGTIDTSGHPNAVGIDPATGDLFVSDQFEAEFNPGKAVLLEFDPSGVQVEASVHPK